MRAIQPPTHQRGAVLVIFVISLVAILAVAGMALDLGHAYVNKTRLQNVLDATAMSGAMTLSLNGNTATAEGLATSDAIATFDEGVEKELEDAGLTPLIEFSNTLDPFVPGSTPGIFVRASIASYGMPTWLVRILGKNTINVGATAVAGPVTSNTCKLAPIVVCGDPDEPCDPGSTSCHGYDVTEPPDEEECYLKTGTVSGEDDQQTGSACGVQEGGGTGGITGDVGPGNYQLLDFSKIPDQPQCEGGGGAYVRCALAKGVNLCANPGTTAPTKPGNTVGPTAQGINTTLGMYQGPVSPDEYPPDKVTDYDNPANGSDPVVYYNEYFNRLTGDPPDHDESDGLGGRRVKQVIIGDCSGTINGQGDVPVLTTGCFFITQPAEQSGAQRIWGQFIGKCGGNGNISLTPSAFSTQKIILYKDPDNVES